MAGNNVPLAALAKAMTSKYTSALLFILLPLASLFTSCQDLVPPLVIPTYGHVDSISYHFDTLLVGENSHWTSISDAWVYLDDNPVGAFQMPCTFPIIANNGVHTITIYPGIMTNGVPSARAKYPFYSSYSINVNLTQGSTVKFTPKCTYTSFAHFAWLEYFTTGCSITSKNVLSDTSMNRMTSGGYPCKYYGAVILDSTSPTHFESIYEGVSDSMTLPKDAATQVYLEINYNCSNVCAVGLYASSIGNTLGNQLPPIVYLFPTGGNWEKMYINLGPTVATNPNGEPFTVYFQTARTPGTTNAYLYLDNIKLVD